MGSLNNGQPILKTTNVLRVHHQGDLLKLGVIPLEDMLPETAYVKLMWVLGQTQDPKKVVHLLKTNIAGEIGDRRTF